MTKLPIVWHNEMDAGYYIDAGPSIVRDPDNGKLNAGIYRHERQAKDELGFMPNPAHHGAFVLRFVLTDTSDKRNKYVTDCKSSEY